MPRKQKSPAPANPRPLTGPQRLNKILAAAGLGSRRECEQLIIDGRIEIDGQPVTDLATKVDPEVAKITFDGSALRTFRPVYYALHKPSGVLSTNRDPSGRTRAIDLLQVKERVFSVGRLDRSSEGLMLLTNDGELAQRLAHPRFGIQKLYLATVQGEVTQEDLEKLVRGVYLAEGFAKVDAVKVRRQRTHSADLEIALSEGKNREIRRILARLGHKVVALRRLSIGPLRLGQLPVGGWRPLSREEVLALYAATSRKRSRKTASKTPSRSGDKAAARSSKSPSPLALGQFDNPLDDDEFLAYAPLGATEDDDLLNDSEEDLVSLSEQPTLGTVIGDDEDEAPPIRQRRTDSRRPRRAEDGRASRRDSSGSDRGRSERSGKTHDGGPYANARSAAASGGRRASFGKKQGSGRGAPRSSSRSTAPRATSTNKRTSSPGDARGSRPAGNRASRSAVGGKPAAAGRSSGGVKRSSSQGPATKGSGARGPSAKGVGLKRSGPKRGVKRSGGKPPRGAGGFGKPRGKRP